MKEKIKQLLTNKKVVVSLYGISVLVVLYAIAMLLGLFGANEDELKAKISKLKPIDVGNVEVLNVKDVGDSYICRLNIKENNSIKIVPAIVSKDLKIITIGNSYDTKTGFTIGALNMKDYEKYEAFSIGEGSGTDDGGEFYIFTDPDCPICQQLNAELEAGGLLKNTKIHVFFYPLEQIHPASKQKCEYILSLPKEQRAKALKDISNNMSNAYASYKASDEVSAMLKESVNLGNDLHIQGTPTVIDGGGVELDTGVWVSFLRALERQKHPESQNAYREQNMQPQAQATSQGNVTNSPEQMIQVGK